MKSERLSTKMIIDLCIEQDIQAREGIKIVVEALAHMLKFSNGSLELRLQALDSIHKSIENLMKET